MTDDTSDLTIHILRQLQADLKALREDIGVRPPGCGTVFDELTTVRKEAAELRREMRDRFDNLIMMFGNTARDHDRRINVLEVRMDRVDPPPVPPRGRPSGR